MNNFTEQPRKLEYSTDSTDNLKTGVQSAVFSLINPDLPLMQFPDMKAVASKIEVFMFDDREPRIRLNLPWSETNLPDPEKLSAVVYCETLESKTPRTESTFMDIEDVDWANEKGYITVVLEITNWNTLLLDLPRYKKESTMLAGGIWSGESLNWPRPVIGLSISMGSLSTKI